ARRQNSHRLWHEQQCDNQQNELRSKRQRKDPIGEQSSRGFALGALDMGISWNKRRVEGALGKNRAEMIRQPEGDKERVRQWTGTQNRRQHDVAGESGQSRQKGKAADGEYAPEHRLLLQEPRSAQNGAVTRRARHAQP